MKFCNILSKITLFFSNSFGSGRHCVWSSIEIDNLVPIYDHDLDHDRDHADHDRGHDVHHDLDRDRDPDPDPFHGDLGLVRCGDYCWCSTRGLRRSLGFRGYNNPWRAVFD